ncbi:hypothetical protein ACHAWC_007618 [Mediolabrus comicus]
MTGRSSKLAEMDELIDMCNTQSTKPTRHHHEVAIVFSASNQAYFQQWYEIELHDQIGPSLHFDRYRIRPCHVMLRDTTQGIDVTHQV